VGHVHDAPLPLPVTDRQLKGDANRLRALPEQVPDPADATHNGHDERVLPMLVEPAP